MLVGTAPVDELLAHAATMPSLRHRDGHAARRRGVPGDVRDAHRRARSVASGAACTPRTHRRSSCRSWRCPDSSVGTVHARAGPGRRAQRAPTARARARVRVRQRRGGRGAPHPVGVPGATRRRASPPALRRHRRRGGRRRCHGAGAARDRSRAARATATSPTRPASPSPGHRGDCGWCRWSTRSTTTRAERLHLAPLRAFDATALGVHPSVDPWSPGGGVDRARVRHPAPDPLRLPPRRARLHRHRTRVTLARFGVGNASISRVPDAKTGVGQGVRWLRERSRTASRWAARSCWVRDGEPA